MDDTDVPRSCRHETWCWTAALASSAAEEFLSLRRVPRLSWQDLSPSRNRHRVIHVLFQLPR